MEGHPRGFIRRILSNPFIGGLLSAALVLMLVLFFSQWYLITELLDLTLDLVEKELIRQAPEGVAASEIENTFENVSVALMKMPMSYISGKISLRKIKAAANYAKSANTDGEWTSEEVNTMLIMMNAAVGFKRGEK